MVRLRDEKKKALLLEVQSYVDRALEIYPNYGSGIKMKVKVSTDIYKLDTQIEPLLRTFEEIIKVRKSNASIDLYFDYFKNSNYCIRI